MNMIGTSREKVHNTFQTALRVGLNTVIEALFHLLHDLVSLGFLFITNDNILQVLR